MANFQTHLIGAAAVSGVAAIGLAMTGVATNEAVVGFFTLGVVGGLLPDIDSDNSIPIRIAFDVLAVLAGFLAVFAFADRFSLAELFIIWIACYLGMRYGVFYLFTGLTVHRGIIHSIPAAAFFGLLTTALAFQVFRTSPLHAWICGVFVACGFIVHLLLDEFYSVDLLGQQLKSSFGTALSLGSLHYPYATAFMYLSVAALFMLCPPPDAFLNVFLNAHTYGPLAERLLPRQGWFRGLPELLRLPSA